MEVKIFLLNKKLFILCNELKKRFAEINSWAVHLSGPCCKIRSRLRETIRILLFIAHPVQLYNNWSIHYLVKLFSIDHYSRWLRQQYAGHLSHMNSVKRSCSPWVLVAQWIERPPGVWEIIRFKFWFWFFLCPTVVTSPLFHLHIC